MYEIQTDSFIEVTSYLEVGEIGCKELVNYWRKISHANCGMSCGGESYISRVYNKP